MRLFVGTFKPSSKMFLFFAIIFILTLNGIHPDFSYAAEEEYMPCSIIAKGKLSSQQGYIHRNTPFVPLSVYESLGDTSKLAIDKKNKRIEISLADTDIFIGDGITTEFIKTYGGTVYIPMRTIDGELYVPMDSAGQFAKLDTIMDANRIHVTSFTDSANIGKIARDNPPVALSLTEGNLSTPVLKKGMAVFILGESVSYYKIAMPTGEVAYIDKEDLILPKEGEAFLDFYFTPKTKPEFRGRKINLAWQYVKNISPLPPDPNDGIDIIAPTWFDQIVNGNGNIENNGDLGYTKQARENGFFIWATITNNMTQKGSTAYTTTVLGSTVLRNKTIAQYLFYACLYDVDGINIDYEDVRDADRDNLTAFVKEMRKYTERLGLNLSIATLIPKPWTVEYDYAALGSATDFITVMTYDEHYGSSIKAGSVSSQTFYTRAISDLLKYTKKEKILMGIPLYTRIWTVDSSGKNVSVKAVTMRNALNTVADMGLSPEWLSDIGQYYVEYPNGSHTDKIWLEDNRSIANRLSFVYHYDIAGSACWQYSQATEDIWSVFENIYKKGASPSSYNTGF